MKESSAACFALMFVLAAPASSHAGDVPPPSGKETQTCDTLGSGIVRCSGRRLMVMDDPRTPDVRSVEIRTEPLQDNPVITARIESAGIEYVAVSALAQPLGAQTQVTIYAQSFKAGGSADKVYCRYTITGKRK